MPRTTRVPRQRCGRKCLLFIYGPLYTQYLADLKKRNINILETVETLS